MRISEGRSVLLSSPPEAPLGRGVLPSVVYATVALSPFVLDPNNTGYFHIETAAQSYLARDKLHLTKREPSQLRLMQLAAATVPLVALLNYSRGNLVCEGPSRRRYQSLSMHRYAKESWAGVFK